MRWTHQLESLTNDVTIERGRAYAASGRVVSLREQGGRVSATVQGTEPYRVELSPDTFWCDCPVGATGEFCKHCVAVAVDSERSTAERSSGIDLAEHDQGASAATDSPATTGDATTWLEGLSADELRKLLADAIVHVDGMATFVARAQIDTTADLAALADEVKAVFSPRKRFYEYRQANDYAYEVESMVRLLEDRAERQGSAEFLRILQKAIDQTVRTILRSDDSSGLQGMQIGRLLDAHLQAAKRSALSPADAKKTVTWLATFEFGDKQDFFNIDIDQYADALGPAGLNEYRRRLDSAAQKKPNSSAVRYARGRLVILGGDVDEVVAHFGLSLDNAHYFVEVVNALEEAGHHDQAVEYARSGVAAYPQSHQIAPLVERVVADARQRDAVDEVLAVRRRHFEHRPSTTTFLALERDARAADEWSDEQRRAAGAELSRIDPRGWVNLLHEQGDHDAAWTAAVTHPDRLGLELWTKLLRRRATSDPDSTMPYYLQLIDDVLVQADRQNYRTAARLLRDMRDAASAAGRSAEFTDTLNDVMERNRRRPTFHDELRRAGLVEPA